MTPVAELIQALRLDRKRSAWSRAQTLDPSLVKLQGEIDECREALAGNDDGALTAELGDVLWSLLFALIVAGDERGLDLERIASAALAKLGARKPWLFEDGPPLTLEEEATLWIRAKAREQDKDTAG